MKPDAPVTAPALPGGRQPGHFGQLDAVPADRRWRRKAPPRGRTTHAGQSGVREAPSRCCKRPRGPRSASARGAAAARDRRARPSRYAQRRRPTVATVSANPAATSDQCERVVQVDDQEARQAHLDRRVAEAQASASSASARRCRRPGAAARRCRDSENAWPARCDRCRAPAASTARRRATTTPRTPTVDQRGAPAERQRGAGSSAPASAAPAGTPVCLIENMSAICDGGVVRDEHLRRRRRDRPVADADQDGDARPAARPPTPAATATRTMPAAHSSTQTCDTRIAP